MKIKVNVTRHDIDKGCQRAQTRCPVARAIGRHLKKTEYASVSVGAKLLGFYKHRGTFVDAVIDTPPQVATFIRAFDRPNCVRDLLDPFSFELDFSRATK